MGGAARMDMVDSGATIFAIVALILSLLSPWLDLEQALLISYAGFVAGCMASYFWKTALAS